MYNPKQAMDKSRTVNDGNLKLQSKSAKRTDMWWGGRQWGTKPIVY